jgi:hypothetical protein
MGKKYINHSGGADGADFYWGKIGEKYGVVSNHYWYGKKTPHGNFEISDEEFEEGKKAVYEANKTLHRKPERYMNLLARDYSQVKHAEAVYAVSQFEPNGRTVKGGTGWAVQMAIDNGKMVYVFDQIIGHWFVWLYGNWILANIPKLTQNFAGIGSRDITAKGIKAIEEVYKETFGY